MNGWITIAEAASYELPVIEFFIGGSAAIMVLWMIGYAVFNRIRRRG